MLSKIRNGNLEELDSYYKKELNNYTSLYQQYLQKMSGNDDDKQGAENELKPQIIEKNKLLINLAQVFLENNERSAELINEDYKMIEVKTSQLENLKRSFGNLTGTVMNENKEEEVKAQKKIENMEGVGGRNKVLLTTLTVVGIDSGARITIPVTITKQATT